MNAKYLESPKYLWYLLPGVTQSQGCFVITYTVDTVSTQSTIDDWLLSVATQKIL